MSRRREVPFGLIGFGGIAAAAGLLIVLGPPRDRTAPRVAPPAPAPAVTAGGFTLTAAAADLPAADLPADDATFPDRPGVAAVQANCTGCHSPAMILSQPPLTREQWQGEVEKMQKAYHAPVDARAVPTIVAFLSSPRP